MPTTLELITKIKDLIKNQEWITTTLFSSNKRVASQNTIRFTPLLSAYYLSLCDGNHQIIKIISHIANELLNNNDNSQWNYHCNHYHYPNDLDDTITAATVLLKINTNSKQNVVAQCIKNLIAVEEKPGGPYRTWFTAQQDPHWGKDIDVIINYRVQRFLQELTITLPYLSEWLKIQANTDGLSPYYSQFEAEVVKSTITDKWDWHALSPANVYEASILLIYTLTQHKQKYVGELYDYYRLLIETPITKIFALPAFVDKVNAQTTQWAGSKLLSASACLSAIMLFQKYLCKRNYIGSKRSVENGVQRHINKIISLLPQPCRCAIQKQALKLCVFNHSPALHYVTKQLIIGVLEADNRQIQEKIIATTVVGWIAYTLLDENIDSQHRQNPDYNVVTSRILTLATQNSFLNCCKVFHHEDTQLVSQWIRNTYIQMEQTYILDMMASHNSNVSIDWEKHLYQRSAGLAIAPVLLCKLQNMQIPLQKLLDIYKPLIIARQILDDVHDLDDDLKHNRKTFVSSQLEFESNNQQRRITKEQLSAVHAYSFVKITAYVQKAQKQVDTLPYAIQEIFIPEIQRLRHILDQQAINNAVINELLKDK